MKWIIEYDRLRWDEVFLDRLLSILHQEKCEYKITQYIPFGGGIYNFFNDNDEVIVIGSINLIKQLQQEKSWKPLAYCNWNILDYRYYYKQYNPDIMLNHPIFTSVGSFIEDPTPFFIYGYPGIFVKPTRNDKKFNADVIHKDDKNSFCEFLDHLMINELLHPNEPIFISDVQENIKREYRLVVSNKEIVTGSVYQENGEHIERETENCTQLQQFITDNVEWEPHPIYVMDVAELEDGQFKIIEIGSINCAGLYECNAEKIYNTIKGE